MTTAQLANMFAKVFLALTRNRPVPCYVLLQIHRFCIQALRLFPGSLLTQTLVLSVLEGCIRVGDFLRSSPEWSPGMYELSPFVATGNTCASSSSDWVTKGAPWLIVLAVAQAYTIPAHLVALSSTVAKDGVVDCAGAAGPVKLPTSEGCDCGRGPNGCRLAWLAMNVIANSSSEPFTCLEAVADQDDQLIAVLSTSLQCWINLTTIAEEPSFKSFQFCARIRRSSDTPLRASAPGCRDDVVHVGVIVKGVVDVLEPSRQFVWLLTRLDWSVTDVVEMLVSFDASVLTYLVRVLRVMQLFSPYQPTPPKQQYQQNKRPLHPRTLTAQESRPSSSSPASSTQPRLRPHPLHGPLSWLIAPSNRDTAVKLVEFMERMRVFLQGPVGRELPFRVAPLCALLVVHESVHQRMLETVQESQVRIDAFGVVVRGSDCSAAVFSSVEATGASTAAKRPRWASSESE
jgi:hypothetical protein